MTRSCKSEASAIGATPMVRLTSLPDADGAEVWVKWEGANPTGSMKDRMAVGMIDAAEREGRLRPGMRVVEATGGSTGAALAMVCARRGYRVRFVHAPARNDEVRLELDLTVAADGSVAARIPGVRKVSDVTLKRGVVGSVPPSTWLSFQAYACAERDEAEAIGDMLLELPDTGSDAEFQIDLPYVLGDGSVRFWVADAHPGSHIRMRFDPVAGQRLVGTPSSVFNQPAAGAPLFADLPVPAPGQSVDLLLTVAASDSPVAAPGTKVRVKIKHSI